MKISVIIPAYNAEKYIENSIASAHHFDCVTEIIVVEDNSPDKTLDVCQKALNKFPKLRIFTHPNRENKGAGPTRNLGILEAENEWIAFLDADDIFNKNRFDKELEYFKNEKVMDGVYGALGVHYYNEKAKVSFQAQFGKDFKLTTVNQKIEPEVLKYVLLGLHDKYKGYFSLDTLTVKKQLLIDAHLFNGKLRLHQDTEMIIKLSCIGKLVSGEINEPVSSRGVHEENRITNNKNINKTRLLLNQELYQWFICNSIHPKFVKVIGDRISELEFISSERPDKLISSIVYSLKHPYIFYNDAKFSKIIENTFASETLKSIVIIVKEKLVITFFSKQREKYQQHISKWLELY